MVILATCIEWSIAGYGTVHDDTTVTAEEEEVLMGNPTSVAGDMAKLQVSSPDSHKPEDGETPQ